MKLWNNYKNLIERNCASSPEDIKDLAYWRNNLFSRLIIYVLPLSFIALIPSLYFVTSILKLYAITVIDIVTLCSLVLIAFVPKIPIHTRKIILMVVTYSFSIMLIFYNGIYGGEFIYLQAACVFFILIFPSKYAYYPVLINLSICIFFAFAQYWSLVSWPDNNQNTIGAWVALSSNLLFLNLLEATLIPKIFSGLEKTLEKEKQLQNQTNNQQLMLEQNLEKLELKNQELEQFAYITSHDLQEPLRMITSFLGLLEKKYSSTIDGKGKEYIHFAVDGASRMRQIIIDLLEYSRAGIQQTNSEIVDLNDLINDISVLFRNQIKEKQAVIMADNLPILTTYKTPLYQVFQNLISNALKYNKGETPVEIKIQSKDKGSYWEFSVQDNGIGISEEYFQKVFIIFQRLHTKEQYKGTGIGLAICKKIIDTFGGKIWIQSKEGIGTTFYFTILKTYSNDLS